MRGKVVEDVAHLYITNHCKDLVDRPGILAIHRVQQQATVLQSLRSHVQERVDRLYPSSTYTDIEGAIPPELLAMAATHATTPDQQSSSSQNESA